MKTPAHSRNGGRRTSPVQAVLAGASRPETVQELLGLVKKQSKRYRKALTECKKEFSESAVHDSRIETRRMLAMLELLGPWLGQDRLRKARAALKRHLDTFDDLRDTHVQLLEVRRLKKRFSCLKEFQDYLLCREKKLLRRTRKQTKCIQSRRWSKRIAGWQSELDRLCAKERPARTVAKLLGGVRTAFSQAATLLRKIDPADTNTIHCTRVAFKRFRYMVETLSCLVPGSNRRLLTALHDYQTLMGEIQDAEVLLRRFEKFLAKHASEANEVVRRELLRRRHVLIQRYLAHAKQLFDFSPEPAQTKVKS